MLEPYIEKRKGINGKHLERRAIDYVNAYAGHRKPFVFKSGDKPVDLFSSGVAYLECAGKEYRLPAKFNSLAEEIKESEFIPRLEDDWDGMGARKVSPELYHACIATIIQYAWKLQEMKIWPPDIEINPCPDGTVDVAWYGNNARMLMNFREENNHKEPLIYYYGAVDQDYETEPIKGATSSNKPAAHLLAWVKECLV